MADLGLTAGPGFALLAAFLYYAGGGAALTAFFTAALAHELGHLSAMAFTGAQVRAVRLTAAGPVIEYGGALSPREELCVVAAGPVFGLVFAAVCLWLGTPYFRYAGLIALLSSAFNLLPVLPLDGGRLALALLRGALSEEAALRVLRCSGLCFGLGAAVTGAFLPSPWAAAAGVWLAVLAVRPDLR